MEQYQLALINDRGGDISARWYVEYKFKNPETGKWQKFREWISNKILTRSARAIKANEVRNRINQKLKQGFSPFESIEERKNIENRFE